MSLPKRYNPKMAEPALLAQWQADGTYHFDPNSDMPVFSIDTPPPSVSGHLHLGHVYSYSQTDFIARFFRMNGRNLFYPMGFDDNGLPTEKLIERQENVRASDIGRQAFIDLCLKVSEETEDKYRELWQRLGLSIDWRYTYRTIDDNSRRLAQWSFLDLHRKGLAYRQKSPAIWCPECQTAIAQAELNDLERESMFYTLAFTLADGSTLPIATTRPELLPACVAVFVHPEDGRFTPYLGQQITTPYTNKKVPLLADPAAEPNKGTGAVMCCTFGDQADVTWWRTHNLPLIEAIGADGRLTQAAGSDLAGHTTTEARQIIIAKLQEAGELLNEEQISQHVRTHERCDTPVEYRVVSQWFIRLLDFKDELLAQGEIINWQPAHMKLRYRQWVENLAWDWCISRQRYFGVPFPTWTCANCGETILADEADLPVDPLAERPSHPCHNCQSTKFIPEADVMDTWATSSLTPQIVGQWQVSDSLYEQTYPFSLRPQAHEIIRTWAFYTIAKSWLHFGTLPFKSVAISGWGLAPAGEGKISKSKKSSVAAPLEMIQQYSADAVRYWAASTGLGKDAIISEEKIQAGAKLVNKLWNVARFCSRFLGDRRLEIGDYSSSQPISDLQSPISFTLADRWLLANTQQLIERTTKLYEQYDYATAKSEIEHFFWQILADNYLEMAKLRLYQGGAASDGARYALHHALLTTIKLLAPILPFVTERIYQGMLAANEDSDSIHNSAWPVGNEAWWDETAVTHGNQLVEIATAVRRYKSEQNLSLGAELASLRLHTDDAELAAHLQTAVTDLTSITRAKEIVLDGEIEDVLVGNGRWQLSIQAT
ncbi:valine--tRNA ligase [Candidatus Leptofilum sp.]|uniref:valine--tRNA ligase n=1 Tax=Candidatus Leptofilum sp. TaxID=3241576 RepID=UPI003B5B6E80